ncbi:MAG: type III-B CRISPR-associated protein Cas10/Cmr2, partial [Nitrososphaeria archaeon]
MSESKGMDSQLAKVRLGALLLYDPGRGELRPENDEIIAALGLDGQLYEKAKSAWNELGPVNGGKCSVPQGFSGSGLNREILEVLKSASDAYQAYLALYALYPRIWMNNMPPECDRLLDASYAASSIAGSDEYYRVFFVLSSVQEFIGYSRKVSDLWASSYLASLLAWGTALDFIETYGPSVVLSPFIGVNPLYLYYVYGKVNSALGSKINDFARELLGFSPRSSFPKYVTLPAKMDLLIPKDDLDPNKLKSLMVSQLKETWRKIYEELSSAFTNEMYKLGNNVDVLIERAKDYPPFPFSKLTIEQVTRSQVVSGANSTNNTHSVIGGSNYSWVDYGFGLAGAEEIYTEDLFNKGERYNFCSVCGTRVAAFSSGQDRSERLCPYCAAKRVMSSGAAAEALERLGIHAENGLPPKFPSTSTLAAAREIYEYATKFKTEFKTKYKLPNLESMECLISNLELFERETNYEVEQVLSEEVRNYGNYFAILRGDLDNLGELFNENRALVDYISVSRNIAIAAIDVLRTVVKHGGIPVYSAGDDLSALFPSFLEDGVPVALMALGELIERCNEGKENVIEGKLRYHMFSDHCRSYSLALVHAKDPLSVSWKASGDLVELKDHFCYEDKSGIRCKRMVAVLRMTGQGLYVSGMKREAAFLPALPEIWSSSSAVHLILWMLESGELSSGMPHDVIREIDTYGSYGIVGQTEASDGVLRMLIERNERKKGAAEAAYRAL